MTNRVIVYTLITGLIPTQVTRATVLLRAATRGTMAWLPLREKQYRIRIDMGFRVKSVGASVMVSASKAQNPNRHS